MEDSEIVKCLVAGDLEKFQELVESANPADLAALKTPEGKTLAHLVVQHQPQNPELLRVLLDKNINPAAKDHDGQSALDALVSTEGGLDLVKQQVIKQLLMAADTDKLRQLLTAGWKYLPTEEELEQIPAELKEELEKLLALQNAVSSLRDAVRENKVDDVKTKEDVAALAKLQNEIGLPLLHEAVLFQNPDIVQHLVQIIPDALTIKDNVGRSALHYAAVCADEGNLYKLLVEAGADDSVKDDLDRTPADYKAQPDLLPVESLKTKLENLLKASQEPKKDSRPQSSADRAAEGEVPAAVAEEQEAPAEQEPEPEPEPPKTPPKPATPPGPKVHKPLEMYVSKQPEDKAPPPSTLDGKYIAQHLGTALTHALAEIAEKRPWDPIEYLANWLYKYHENTNYNKKKEEMLQHIREEEARLNKEEEMKFMRKEELKRFQEEMAEKARQEEEERKRKEQEELQRSAKEAALAQKPQLPTVTEEGEGEDGATPEEQDDDPNVKDRDVNGQTEMHKLATQEGMDLSTLIQLGYSIADRDIKGRTVREVAEESGQKEAVEAIDTYLKKLLEDGRTDILEQLALDGYEGLEEMGNDDTPEVTKTFLERLIGLKEQITSAFKAVETGEEAELKEAIESLPKLAQAKDRAGRTLLHMAVLAKATPIVEHIAANFPEALKARDNANRSALHYANAVSDDLVQVLLTHGASPKARDAMKRTPNYYSNNKADIIAIQKELGLAPSESEPAEVSVENEEQAATEGVSASEDEGQTAQQLATVVTEPASETEGQDEQEKEKTATDQE